MGIKELSKYIRDNTNAYRLQSLSRYSGKKIAVDISVFLYKTIRSNGPEGWVTSMVSLFRCLKKFGIKIVCVFDGPNAPPEKLKEREQRRDTTQKVRDKTELIKSLLEELKQYKGKEIPLDLRRRMKEACMKQRNADRYESIDYRIFQQAKNILEETYKKFAKQCIPITPDYAETVKKLATYLGLAVMQADGEAETMCSYMCVKGLVDAVLTEDTDVLAYGTPIFLSKIDTREETVQCIYFNELIEELSFTPEQFKDFCIMCSCDYNDRIKLKPKKEGGRVTGIGPKKAYNLLLEHGTLDNIEFNTDLDLTPLIYERCRVLFTVPSIYDNLILPYNNPIDKKNLLEFMEHHSCKYMIESLLQIWAPTPLIFEDEEDLPMKSPKKKSTPSPNKRLIGANKHNVYLNSDDELNSIDDNDKIIDKQIVEEEKSDEDLIDDDIEMQIIDENIEFERNIEENSIDDDEEENEAPCQRLIGSNKNTITQNTRLIGSNKNTTTQNTRLIGQNTRVIPNKIIDNRKFIIYTDGSCKPNPGAGGWAAIIEDDQGNETILKGNSSQTTNNIMEMTAIIKALEYAQKQNIINIELNTDSDYCKSGIEIWIKNWKRNGWQTSAKTDVKNKIYWIKLDKFNSSMNIKWNWVKAHATNEKNNRVDKIANKQSDLAKDKAFIK